MDRKGHRGSLCATGSALPRTCTPDVEGEKFPALLALGMWGKDAQEAIGWLADKPQKYYHSPFWDGNMEAMNYNFTVPRGYAHVIPNPRGIGNSEGFGTWGCGTSMTWSSGSQPPWCSGKVGMMGPSSYSVYRIHAGLMKNLRIVALHPDENCAGSGDYLRASMTCSSTTYSWADMETTLVFPRQTMISRRFRPCS